MDVIAYFVRKGDKVVVKQYSESSQAYCLFAAL